MPIGFTCAPCRFLSGRELAHRTTSPFRRHGRSPWLAFQRCKLTHQHRVRRAHAASVQPLPMDQLVPDGVDRVEMVPLGPLAVVDPLLFHCVDTAELVRDAELRGHVR